MALIMEAWFKDGKVESVTRLWEQERTEQIRRFELLRENRHMLGNLTLSASVTPHMRGAGA